VRLIALTRDFGNQNARLAGLASGDGEPVVTMDCDPRHPPSLIPEMVAAWRDGHAVVRMVRDETHDDDPAGRIMSRDFCRLLNLLSDTPITTPGTILAHTRLPPSTRQKAHPIHSSMARSP
jgi:glycosyltransferase involved in cell wall biosynthesis